jgi:flagellar biosynthesis protein
MSDDTHDTPDGRGRRPVAVALQWDAARGDAPIVTAKGEGALAEQILQVAFDRGVKVRTDADLAEVLRASELDREIPYAAYVAVAEILTYLYRANGAAAPGPTDDADTADPSGPPTDEAPE